VQVIASVSQCNFQVFAQHFVLFLRGQASDSSGRRAISTRLANKVSSCQVHPASCLLIRPQLHARRDAESGCANKVCCELTKRFVLFMLP
jgi:hypothetical protein